MFHTALVPITFAFICKGEADYETEQNTIDYCLIGLFLAAPYYLGNLIANEVIIF